MLPHVARDDTGPTFVESSGTANNPYRLSLKERVRLRVKNRSKFRKHRQRNQEQHQQGKVDSAFFHSGLPYNSLRHRPGKVPPVFATRPARNHPIVRDVWIFINSRSRGGASL